MVVWKGLIHFQQEGDNVNVTIHDKLPKEPTTLEDAIIGLLSFKELDDAAKKLWERLDTAVFRRRTDIRAGSLPNIQVKEARNTTLI